MTTDVQVVHNEAAHRFEANLDGNIAHADYISGSGGTTLIFTHTEVPEELEGRGIGGKLARFALEYAQANNLRVQPLCPFIRAYIERHPEYQHLSTAY
ncbi:MAG: N-acetyltransferase [Chloroflexi bacterium]|nr:N-acetyltransferase [Chloroflexota bacterium]